MSIATRLTDRSGRQFYPWCGWMIDVRTAELRPHLARARAALARAGRPPPSGACPMRMLSLLCKAARPKLHRAFVDPQVNSTLTVRRNVFIALLHALLQARLVTQTSTPARILATTLSSFLSFVSATATIHQRRAVLVPPHGVGSSTLLASCEVVWLGWAAIEVVAHHRSTAAIGSRDFLLLARRRRARALRQCVALSDQVMPLLTLACDPGGFAVLPPVAPEESRAAAAVPEHHNNEAWGGHSGHG